MHNNKLGTAQENSLSYDEKNRLKISNLLLLIGTRTFSKSPKKRAVLLHKPYMLLKVCN